MRRSPFPPFVACCCCLGNRDLLSGQDGGLGTCGAAMVTRTFRAGPPGLPPADGGRRLGKGSGKHVAQSPWRASVSSRRVLRDEALHYATGLLASASGKIKLMQRTLADGLALTARPFP